MKKNKNPQVTKLQPIHSAIAKNVGNTYGLGLRSKYVVVEFYGNKLEIRQGREKMNKADYNRKLILLRTSEGSQAMLNRRKGVLFTSSI